jgi:hypothetical protein
VTRFHGNAWAAMLEPVEVVIARQQGKCVCAGQQHATVGQAVLSGLRTIGAVSEEEAVLNGVSDCTVSQESLWLWYRDSLGT